MQSITLTSGIRVAVEIAKRVIVTASGSSHEATRVELPYPRHGVGGGRLIVSPRERFVILSMFSGQSEERYDLFSLEPALTRIGGLEYVLGEGASFAFSADERTLFMGVPATGCDWWDRWEDAVTDSDDPTRMTLQFAHVYCHELGSNTISQHEMSVSAPEAWRPAQDEYDSDLRLRVSDSQLRAQMPWGELVVPIPLPARIVVRLGD